MMIMPDLTDPDRVRGTLYGQAVGDCLGIPIEFKSKMWIALKYGEEGAGPYQYEASRDFKKGEWSDDTAMAAAVLRTYLEHRKIAGKTAYSGAHGGYVTHGDVPELQDFASAFWAWLIADGRGSGRLTRHVLTDPKFLTDPHGAAHRMWVRGKRNAAANGAVMRTSYVGLIRPMAPRSWTEKEAARVARVTHWDPRCVASAVAVSVAVSCLVTGQSIEEAIESATYSASHYSEDVTAWMSKGLEELDLDEGLDDPNYEGRPPIGYTYKTLGAAFWALRQVDSGSSFMEILGQILWEGGDTDTNAAVAGAVLGAAMGASAIPTELIDGIYEKDKLEGFYQALVGSPTDRDD